MAVFLSRLEWIKKKGQGDTQVIDNWKSITVRLSSELKSNRMTINLANDFGSAKPRMYNDNQGNIVGPDAFQADDKFKLYAKYDSNNSGLDLSEDSNDLIFFGDLRPVKSKVDDKAMIRLTCTDRTFNILNRIAWPNYHEGNNNKAPNGQGWTVPLIIQDLIRQRGGTNKRAVSKDEIVYDELGHKTPSDAKNTAFYLIDARLRSESDDINSNFNGKGFIQDNRSISIDKDGATVSRNIGTPDSDTSLFPTVPISTQNFNFPFQKFIEIGKPVYELLQNLSQVDMTNTVNELDADNSSFDPIIKRSMRFYLDENMRFHWFYPTSNVDDDKFGTSLDITMGTTTNYEVKNHDLDYDIFEVINFIYFEAGVDMNGNSILGFRYDSTSGAPTLKESKRSWPRISEAMKQEDDIILHPDSGNISPDATKLGGYAFPTDYGTGINPRWNTDVTVTNDTEYNTEFKNEVRVRANRKADSIIKGASSQRWKGNMEFRFHNFTVTDLIQYTSEAGGLANKLLRIGDVTHNIQPNAAFTTLSVEEDGKELEA